ncbi:MAG: peptidylprolyl isomerase [Bacteroidota bacterium]|nr:peptidylprolyl isomerase [Bacteroidota bacterium]MDP4232412.1 peptidylprolyl isomerase [Bacteroidota bacterium]MDP4241548.1 peptidylprolyl isomerase [Bacteroidota bacterium]MDP4288282.1 peptidylprolyl isomerase [Bacteroidota bacterium]
MRLSIQSLIRLLSVAVAILTFVESSGAQQLFTGKPQYQIEVRRADTVMGRIIVELFPAIAPNSVRNWDSLVGIHFYDSTAFHRVIPGFMIQGGDPNSRSGDPSTWGYGDPSQQTVDSEFSAISHRRGILSAARASDPNSATSQFFICVASAAYLDRHYSVYGHVIQGMSVADSIVMAPRDGSDRPYDKISMFITRIGSNDSLEPAPALASPTNGFANGIASKVTMRWHLVHDAMMYELQMATDTGFNHIVIDSTFNQIDTIELFSKLKTGTTYYWHVLANNGGHASAYSPTWTFNEQSLGVAEPAATELDLSEPLPNPTQGGTLLRFNLKQEAVVRFSIQDMLGRTVMTLLDARMMASGDQEVTIPTTTLIPGVYLCRFECMGNVISKKLVVE